MLAGRQYNLAQVAPSQEGVEEAQSRCGVVGTDPGDDRRDRSLVTLHRTL